MEKKDYIVHGIWFDPRLYNETIQKSPMYRDRISFVAGYLSRQLFLTDEEVAALGMDERFGTIPFRLVTELAIRLTSFGFEKKYGVHHEVVDGRQVAMEVENLEYGRIPKEKMTPIHHEYIALWAEELEKLFGEVKGMKRQFPREAYEKPAAEKPAGKKNTLQDSMDELFKNSH